MTTKELELLYQQTIEQRSGMATWDAGWHYFQAVADLIDDYNRVNEELKRLRNQVKGMSFIPS